MAIQCTGQEGTIVAVSYFGTKVVPLRLAPEFHHRRHRLASSQVSVIGSGLQPGGSLNRRSTAALQLLSGGWLVTPVTHRIPFTQAPTAYQLLDTNPDEAMSIVLTYDP